MGQKNFSRIICFNQWSRKKYAVFNSIRKLIKICTLSLAYSIVVMPEQSQAQENKDSIGAKNYELDDAVVTAERTPVSAQQVTRIVQVITRSDIERAPAQNLNDLLRYISGADIRQRGPLGAQADISIRGGTYEQTLILLNGVNVNDPQTGHHNLNLPIDLESIERIEILEGPAAKSFGPNAFNGIINIITGNSKPNHVRVSAMAGQHGLYKLSENISQSSKNFHQFISINWLSSDGYMFNTSFTGTNIFYQAGYESKAGTFDLQTGYNNKEFGANGFYSLALPNEYEYTNTEFVSLRYKSNTKIKIAPILYLRRHRDDFEWDNVLHSIPASHHLTTTTGLNLNMWMTSKLGKTSLGADIRNESIISNSYGLMMNETIPVPNFDSAFYTKSFDRLLISYYLEHSVTAGIFRFSGGLMMHQNSEMKTPGLFPGLDISAHLGQHFKAFANTGKTLRMPSYTEMFLANAAYQGNRNLRPEEAFNIETGLKAKFNTISGSLSIFEKWGNNSIDWVKDSTKGKWQSVNHSKVTYKGVTAMIDVALDSYTGGIIHSARISYTYLTSDTIKKYLLSKYVLDYLKHQFTVSLDHAIYARLNVSWRLTYLERMGSYPDAKGIVTAYKPFWMADARIYWKDKHYTIYTEATNLFNTSFFDFGGIVQPGLWVKAGFVLDLDRK